ncbi:MAG: ribonuclease P protein component [Candidatus Moranbacteria bacterium]|nr:ribonuclease P protein component [Candidatus Moranbacteria bacterium]
MLPKKNRIREGADFGAICRYSRSFSADGLILRIRENQLGLVRLGVSVGLKFSSKAVARNRMKRQVRAFFEQNLARIATSQDVVVIVGKTWEEKANPGPTIRQILVKNGLFKE